jgi:hypothetical protein
MYIKKADFSYFETLNKDLDEAKRKRFRDELLKDGARKTGEDIKKIQVVGDEIFDERGIDPKEFITRTMIKKAYKAAKGELPG